MTREEQIQRLLSDKDLLLAKRPFTRGSGTTSVNDFNNREDTNVLETRTAQLPDVHKYIITQDRFLKEYDPESHDVMFDQNMPSICVKLADDNGYQEIKFKRMPLPLQQRITEKQTLTLCGNKRDFTLDDSNPSDKVRNNYATFLKAWRKRNIDGIMSKAVGKQLMVGDVAMLFYRDYKGRIKARIFSYDEGYVIISHNDDNGDRLLECIYYATPDGAEHCDCYDDTYHYHLTDADGKGWHITKSKHGFSEIPVATKRGDVAWNTVQSLIEAYEILYNIFLVIQKRHGWGILYIKGNFSQEARKIAGSIILQDRSIDHNGTAEFKTPPSPEGTIETLQTLFEQIQIGSSTTFLLPKDVKSNGDVSALAIMLTQSLDLEGGSKKIIDWQNFADKCARLFKEGYAKELVESGENRTALTDFESMDITCKFKLWRPFSESEYNNMLVQMKGAGILSTKTAVELSTVSAPDELIRVENEAEKNREQTLQQQQAQAQAQAQQTQQNTTAQTV